MSADGADALEQVRQWIRTQDPAQLASAIKAMSDLAEASRLGGGSDPESEYILVGLLLANAEHTGQIEDLDAAILLMRRAVRETAEYKPLFWLCSALVARSQSTGRQPDIDEAADLLRRAVADTPNVDPDYPAMIKDLLKVLFNSVNMSGDTTALTAAITDARRAIRLVSDQNPEKAELALAIAISLSHPRLRTESADNADLIIDTCRLALRLPLVKPETRKDLLGHLATSLTSRYTRYSDPADLDEAIRIRIDAHDPRSARNLFDQATALHSRFERDGRPDDLQKAVQLTKRAVDVATNDDTRLPLYRAALFGYLAKRSQAIDNEAVRDEEIAINRRLAQGLPDDDPQRELFLANTGRLLYARYQDRGNAADLTESVEMLRQSAELAARSGDLYLGDTTRVHLALALVAVFDRTGDVASLDEALEIGRMDGLHAVRRSDDGRGRTIPVFPADDERQIDLATIQHDGGKVQVNLASVLAHALTARYEQIGDLADLDDALVLATTALDLAPAADAARLIDATGHVARIYGLRHERTGDHKDLDHAIEFVDTLLTLLPRSHRDRPVALQNLTILLTRRFRGTWNTADIERAIGTAEGALDSTPSHPGARAGAQGALANALLERHKWRHRRLPLGDNLASTDDLTRAIDFARSAAAHTDPDYASKNTEGLFILIAALRARYELAPNPVDLSEIIDLARQVVSLGVGPTPRNLETINKYACWAADHGAWKAAAELFTACVNIMAKLATPDRHSDTRRYWLARWSLLTRRACASALNAGDPQAAAVLLERGRAILLSQRFDLRADLAYLRACDEDLANRFESLRQRIDDTPLLDAGPAPRLYTLNIEEAAQDRGAQQRRLLKEYEELLAEIRNKPGFDQYLRPAQWADLIAQAEQGSLVIPNISEYRSDALILSNGTLRTVELPHANHNALRYAADRMLNALEKSKTAWLHRDRDAQLRAQSEIGAVLAWLWDAIAEPVLGDLDIAGPPEPGQPWPRMWWIPTGLLSLLPLHAAQRGDKCLLDWVICSYTPTVQALRVARGQESTRERSVLTVAMPETPGAPPLPFADREAVALAGRIGRIVTVSGAQATRERVRAKMYEHTWAHFACHGWSNPVDPGADHLLLHDHQALPFTLTEIAGLRLDSPELVYLSACETARADDELPDEAMHLGSAFRLAGYRHVVATLWTIRDDVGAELADNFYAYLLDGQCDPATALHHACRQVRQKFKNFPALWASHLHIGP